MQITEENCMPLLSFAETCQITELVKLLVQFTNSRITRENAIPMLERALKLNMKVMIDKCLFVIAKHFRFIYDADYSFLSVDYFLSLLTHPNLNVTNEYGLYLITCNYIKKKGDSITKAQSKELLSTIHYRFMSFEHLKAVTSNPFVPRQALLDATILKLADKESPNLAEGLSSDNPRLVDDIHLLLQI